MLAILHRELRALFLSPQAWFLLGVMQLILAWIFLAQIAQYLQLQPRLVALDTTLGVTDLIVVPLLESALMVIMLLIPLITMRLFSEEYQNRTIDLLFSAPVSLTRIALGKFLASLILVAIMLALVSIMPLSLLFSANLDLGRIASGLLGLLLASAGFMAVGLFFSATTHRPGVAAISTFGLLLLLWVLPQTGSSESSPLFSWLSPISHFRTLTSGLVQSSDLLYFLLFCATFLGLTIHRLELRRTQN